MKINDFDRLMDNIISVSTYVGILSFLLIKVFQYSGNINCSDFLTFLPLLVPFTIVGGTIVATKIVYQLEDKKLALKEDEQTKLRDATKNKNLCESDIQKQYQEEQAYLKSYCENKNKTGDIQFLKEERKHLTDRPTFDTKESITQKTKKIKI